MARISGSRWSACSRRPPSRCEPKKLNKPRLFFLLLFALLLAARLCHVEILWAEETLPLAAAQQMRAGKVLYRDIWFDKPPFAPVFYRVLGGEAGWPLRAAGALYALLCCWIAWGF